MSAISEQSLELISRYEGNGPRYTSYPTAKQFHASFNEKHYREIAAKTNEDLIPKDLSLYVHIPFCQTVCFYCACNKIITANHKHAADYLHCLFKEIRLQAKLFDRDRSVEQLHFGGGTPTYLTETQLVELMGQINQYFNLRHDDTGDYSVEIDPRQLKLETLTVLRELGFNRISIGVQDFSHEVQKAVNRIQTLELTESVMNKARMEGFRSINIDLIYGLPLQTADSFSTTLEQVIALSPDRLAIYNYAHMPHLFKTQKNIIENQIPSSNVKLDILKLAIVKLQTAGYKYIGMDHFAKPEDELFKAQKSGGLHRNFQGYTTHGNCDLIGLGVSAISRVGDSYSQNLSSLEDYKELLSKGCMPVRHGFKLDSDDCLRRDVITSLICNFQVLFERIEDLYGINFQEYFYNELIELKSMDDDGLLVIGNGEIKVTVLGRLLIRNICMVFDKYLTADSNTATYSKVL